jgi:hypothetical protein
MEATSSVAPTAADSNTMSAQQQFDYDTPEIIAMITNPMMFTQEMRALDLDVQQVPFGKIPPLSKCLLLLRMIRDLIQKISLNSIEQNRLISLSNQFFQLLPQQNRAAVDLFDVFSEISKRKMMERLLDIEAVQNEIFKAGGTLSFRETLSAKLRPIPLDFQMRASFKEALEDMRSPFSIKNIWQLSDSHPGFDLFANPQFLFHAPPFSSVASQLLSGVRPLTLEGFEDPMIRLFPTAQRAVSNMNAVRLPNGTLAGIICFVEVALGELLSSPRYSAPSSVIFRSPP